MTLSFEFLSLFISMIHSFIQQQYFNNRLWTKALSILNCGQKLYQYRLLTRLMGNSARAHVFLALMDFVLLSGGCDHLGVDGLFPPV